MGEKICYTLWFFGPYTKVKGYTSITNIILHSCPKRDSKIFPVLIGGDTYMTCALRGVTSVPKKQDQKQKIRSRSKQEQEQKLLPNSGAPDTTFYW